MKGIVVTNQNGQLTVKTPAGDQMIGLAAACEFVPFPVAGRPKGGRSGQRIDPGSSGYNRGRRCVRPIGCQRSRLQGKRLQDCSPDTGRRAGNCATRVGI